VTVFGGLGIVLASGFYLPLTLLAPLSASTAQILPWVAPVTEAPVLDWPDYGASAIGAIDFPGTLAVGGSAEALPIASITKVITALVVLESKPLGLDEAGPDISFTSADVRLYTSYLHRNGKVEPVRSGIVLNQRQVLELTLVASANNYTASLVNWAFGSEEAFLPVARAWLTAHGLNNTFLSDATGMDPENRATATDLIELGKIALADPIVSLMVDTEHISIPDVGEIDNTNDLLGEGGVRGIKTGTLDEAGACLLFAADYTIGSEVVTVIGVMLGGKDHPSLDEDIRKLLTTAQSGFHEVSLATAGANFASYATAWGDRSDVVATESASIVLWADTPITLLVQAAPVTLDEAGTAVGSLSFSVGTRTIDVPLELTSEIDDPGAWWRLTHPGELF
jgi:D-alanyl-D-alanine carboxypeptidase (penicillin-binding protein 5/6)